MNGHYLCVRVGREWYGIRVDEVVEVLHLVALSELPGAPPDVLGLMTLRDSVMPVVDLRRRFGLPESPLRISTPIVAVKTAVGALGLVVDEADDVAEVHEIMAQQGTTSPYVESVARLPGRLLMLLDVPHLCADALALSAV